MKGITSNSVGRIAGKVGIVTGASAGIGRAVALRFAREGATVLAASRRATPIALPAEATGDVVPYACDVSDTAQVDSLIAECRRRYGRLDVVCHGAGFSTPPALLHETTLANWDAVMNVNLRGAFIVLKAVIPLMLESGGGSIINIASIGSFRASAGSAPYISSKGGMLMLTRTAALDYVKMNIWVNAVGPGVTDTEILNDVPAETRQKLLARVPMGRMGTSDEVASLALFLASDEATYITGASYVIDGGRSAG